MTEHNSTPSKLDQPEILAVLFQPRQEPRTPLGKNCFDLDIPAGQSGFNLGCRLHLSSEAAPNILYFHGNGETVADYGDVADFYSENGMNLLIATYRGYGWSDGSPSVSSLFGDNDRIFEFFNTYREKENLSGPLFVMGRSLGAVSAIDLAYRYHERLKGLIIESGFAHTLPVLANLGCDVDRLNLSEQDCFDNLGKIREISLPTLILHGQNDSLIPMTEGVSLQADSGAKTKQLQLIPGADHNTTIAVGGRLYFETIKKFIDGVTGANTWRQRRKRFKKNEA